MTLNGFDYSNDNATFGFYDPYVVDASPRLIAVDGTTRVTLKGLGFADSGETKVKYQDPGFELHCPAGNCVKRAEFIDKRHIVADTFPQKDVAHFNGQSVMWDPVYVEGSVYNDDFTDNRVAVYYYEEPTYEVYSGETPANIQTEIFIKTQIAARDLRNIKKYGQPRARFSSGDQTIIVDAVLLYSPLVSAYDGSDFLDPNTIKIRTPRWTLPEGQSH